MAQNLERLLAGLRAAGEPSRLRLLGVLAHAELTVSELTRILGQSQPRISRHLKLLCEAGLLERTQEGAWAFFRLAQRGPGARLARALLEHLPGDEPVIGADLERLAAVKREHAERAARYFRDNAGQWDRIRGLYVGEARVEAAMLSLSGEDKVDEFLDLGTGTGRILEIFAPRVKHGLGIDSNREMLAVARAHLESAAVSHCQIRHGDIFHLPVAPASVDLVTIHQVLHFLDDPGTALSEAARTLRVGGRLIIVDFAPHSLEFLRTEHAHRRLGFADAEVAAWCRDAGLTEVSVRHLETREEPREASLTVTLWTGRQTRDRADAGTREVA